MNFNSIESQGKGMPLKENENISQVDIAFSELIHQMYPVLETYANIQRGNGYNAGITTDLFENARKIVLDFLNLDSKKYLVIFSTPNRNVKLNHSLKPGSFFTVTSDRICLPLGVTAFAVRKNELPKEIPFITGGGTTRLYSAKWVIPSDAPERFEAGTPAIINIIMFSKALQTMRKYGLPSFAGLTGSMTVMHILHEDALLRLKGMELFQQLKNKLIGNNSMVPCSNGSKPYINFDHSASTRTFEPVWNSFVNTLKQPVEQQKEVLKEVKKIVADFLNAPEQDYHILFTSNTTESVNLVAEFMMPVTEAETEPVVLTTMLEHSSNDLPWRQVKGLSIIRLPVDKHGFWDVQNLEEILSQYNRKKIHGKKRITLVAVCGASNVLGTCNDLTATGRAAHKYGARFLVDAAQLVAHRKINIIEEGIDYLVFSAHKIYAPFGTGVLAFKKNASDIPDHILTAILKCETENPGGIAALGKILLLLKKTGIEIVRQEEHKLLCKALKGLKEIPGVKLYGISDPESKECEKKTGVIVFEIKNMAAGKVTAKLASNVGIGSRYGCLCAHLLVKYLLDFNPVQEQVQRLAVLLFPSLKLQGFTRISFGIENTEEEVDTLLNELNHITKA